MAVDWVTTVAQIINFLVLVALLRIFLFRPIVKAMDERESKIAFRLTEAEEKRKQAEEEEKVFKARNLELESLRQERLSQVTTETEALKKELVKIAREEVDQIHEKWQDTLHEEKTTFLTELRRRAGEQTCAVARHALRELANSDLEKLAMDVFLKRLRELDQKRRKIINQSLLKAKNKITVLTAFSITEENQKIFLNLLQDQFSNEIKVSFQTSSDLIFGVECIVADRKIAWSLDHYLDELEKNVQAAFPLKKGEQSKSSVPQSKQKENQSDVKLHEI